MNDLGRQFRDFFVSLRLTVVLLVLSLVLVFVATLDQVNLGIWAVQEKYFRSFFVLWNVGGVPLPVFPGGYVIGGFLLVNLVAAHVYRFSLTWRKAGIQLTHGGLILLLLGELFTGLLQEDFSMRLEQGVPRNYSESFRENELVVIDTTDPKTDEVVAIPETKLRAGTSLQHPRLPFRLASRAGEPRAEHARCFLGAQADTQRLLDRRRDHLRRTDRRGLRWHGDERRGRACCSNCILHGVEHGDSLDVLTRLPWRHATDDLRAVRAIAQTVESTLTTGQTLDDDFRVFVDEDCHGAPYLASSTAVRAASNMVGRLVS